LFVHILRSTIFEEGLCGRFGSLRVCCSKNRERSSSVGDDGTCPPSVLHSEGAVKVSLALFYTIFRCKNGRETRVKEIVFPGFTRFTRRKMMIVHLIKSCIDGLSSFFVFDCDQLLNWNKEQKERISSTSVALTPSIAL